MISNKLTDLLNKSKEESSKTSRVWQTLLFSEPDVKNEQSILNQKYKLTLRRLKNRIRDITDVLLYEEDTSRWRFGIIL